MHDLDNDERLAINLAKSEIREGLNTGDVERVLPWFADEFGDWGFGIPALDGDEAKVVLRERLVRLFAAAVVRFQPTVVEIAVYGQDAVARGWQELTVSPKDGSAPTTLRTRFIELWHKDPNGAWQIRLIMDNPDVPPMMVDEMVGHVAMGRFDEVTRSIRPEV